MRKKFTFICFILMLLVSQFAVFRLMPAVNANPGWLTGWDHRKYHNMTGQAGAGTNYPINVTVRAR